VLTPEQAQIILHQAERQGVDFQSNPNTLTQPDLEDSSNPNCIHVVDPESEPALQQSKKRNSCVQQDTSEAPHKNSDNRSSSSVPNSVADKSASLQLLAEDHPQCTEVNDVEAVHEISHARKIPAYVDIQEKVDETDLLKPTQRDRNEVIKKIHQYFNKPAFLNSLVYPLRSLKPSKCEKTDYYLESRATVDDLINWYILNVHDAHMALARVVEHANRVLQANIDFAITMDKVLSTTSKAREKNASVSVDKNGEPGGEAIECNGENERSVDGDREGEDKDVVEGGNTLICAVARCRKVTSEMEDHLSKAHCLSVDEAKFALECSLMFQTNKAYRISKSAEMKRRRIRHFKRTLKCNDELTYEACTLCDKLVTPLSFHMLNEHGSTLRSRRDMNTAVFPKGLAELDNESDELTQIPVTSVMNLSEVDFQTSSLEALTSTLDCSEGTTVLQFESREMKNPSELLKILDTQYETDFKRLTSWCEAFTKYLKKMKYAYANVRATDAVNVLREYTHKNVGESVTLEFLLDPYKLKGLLACYEEDCDSKTATKLNNITLLKSLLIFLVNDPSSPEYDARKYKRLISKLEIILPAITQSLKVIRRGFGFSKAAMKRKGLEKEALKDEIRSFIKEPFVKVKKYTSERLIVLRNCLIKAAASRIDCRGSHFTVKCMTLQDVKKAEYTSSNGERFVNVMVNAGIKKKTTKCVVYSDIEFRALIKYITFCRPRMLCQESERVFPVPRAKRKLSQLHAKVRKKRKTSRTQDEQAAVECDDTEAMSTDGIEDSQTAEEDLSDTVTISVEVDEDVPEDTILIHDMDFDENSDGNALTLIEEIVA